MAGADFQQESSRYCSHCPIMIARMAAAAAIPAEVIAVRGKGFGRAREGESSDGACEEISELVLGVSGGETADKSAA